MRNQSPLGGVLVTLLYFVGAAVWVGGLLALIHWLATLIR